LAPLQDGAVGPPTTPVLHVIVKFDEVPPAVVNDEQPLTVIVCAVATFAKPNAKAANNAAPPRRLGKREVMDISWITEMLLSKQRQFPSHPDYTVQA
jgi:hypothetical protein